MGPEPCCVGLQVRSCNTVGERSSCPTARDNVSLLHCCAWPVSTVLVMISGTWQNPRGNTVPESTVTISGNPQKMRLPDGIKDLCDRTPGKPL